MDRHPAGHGHCGLGHSACNPVLDTIAKFRPAYERRLQHKEVHAGVRPRSARWNRARQMTGRDDAATPFGAAAGRNMSPTFTHRRQDRAVQARANHHPGGAGRRALHPASVLPPGLEAAWLVQAVHCEGRRPQTVSSCTTPAQPGMVVESDTPAAERRAAHADRRCCSSKATISARRAKKAATASCRPSLTTWA